MISNLKRVYLFIGAKPTLFLILYGNIVSSIKIWYTQYSEKNGPESKEKEN